VRVHVGQVPRVPVPRPPIRDPRPIKFPPLGKILRGALVLYVLYKWETRKRR
jgi:hypothetical protein